MSTAAHQWVKPPAGQSGLPLCSVCGARQTPDIQHPDHPDSGCGGRAQDGVAQAYHASEYDPIP